MTTGDSISAPTGSSSPAAPRAARPDRWNALLQDIRYTLRGLKNSPGFTAAVVITLALGIGANAAMFSIVDRLLFRAPAMLRNPALVHNVYLASTYRAKENFSSGVQYQRYTDLTKWTTSFSRLAEETEDKLAIGRGDDARQMQVGIVSASFFGFFDAPPVLGRYFTAAEDQTPNGTPVAVLAYPMWQTTFGGARDVLGKPIQIGATTYTIIGVAPAGFAGLWGNDPPAAFIPITAYGHELGTNFAIPGEAWYSTYHWTWAEMIAERKPGVSLAAATADMTQAYIRSYQAALALSPHMQPIALERPHALIGSILNERGPNESNTAKVATWITGVAIVVWLIACANVANLLLARALRRRREIAVRLALGVSDARLASQLVTESVVLAMAGGVIGIAIAQWGGALLRSQLLSASAKAAVVTDVRTLLYAGAAALVAGLLAGLAPIVQTRRTNLASDLKAGVREGTYQRSRLRIGLLVFQGTLSVVLLVGAGLFVRSLRQVRNMPLGFDVEHVLSVDLSMRGVKLDSAQNIALRRRLLEATRSIPGVVSATRQLTMPFWSEWDMTLYVAGIDSTDKLGSFDLNGVSPEYFKTMGTRIIAGRPISEADRDGAQRAMVVSEGMAKTLWPGRNAIGQCVKVGADTVPCTYVVGIAENIKERHLDDDPGLYYYMSIEQYHPDMGGLFVRTRGPAADYQETVRRTLQQVMPGSSYVVITPFTQVLGGETQSWRLGATMFVVFGTLALVLAAIGLYSVITYNVAQRTHELGVRAALGARMGDLARLVVREAMQLTVAGVALGLGLALFVARWVEPLLFRESPRDPWVFGIVAAVLLAVAALASFMPAQRAARADPMQALRS
ncbi:MAG TPA: ADOP family duplicated permease, partial [Gemmatimonadaceae bacterium]|nr:ADOP family duplicated permease [Gemmatimonadaceae bacterium]